MKKLPIGAQSFSPLREEHYLYVDKTSFIEDLVRTGKGYFLNRPRRFGKSLLLSTLDAYFRGRKDLFAGLAIETSENAQEHPWEDFPVIHFSLSGREFTRPDGLCDVLDDALTITADQYGLPRDKLTGKALSVRFRQLIRTLKEQTGKPVVVLVDEYDKPLLVNLAENPQQEDENRKTLQAFFGILKDVDSCLKFVFITGVTSFNRSSVFSDPGQLRDISLLPEYSAICGITEKELRQNFRDEIRALAQAQEISTAQALASLARMYGGYRFSAAGESVCTPSSVLHALADRDFGRYWFESGTPTFLVRMLLHSGRPVPDFSDGVRATKARLEHLRADACDMVPLYYQAGYLTISGYDKRFREYTLGWPNDEVRYGYRESLIPMVSPAPRDR